MGDTKESLNPNHLVDYYRSAYKKIHGKSPLITCISRHWYQINGEIVPRGTLLSEIARLTTLAQKTHRGSSERHLIRRLIDRVATI